MIASRHLYIYYVLCVLGGGWGGGVMYVHVSESAVYMHACVCGVGGWVDGRCGCLRMHVYMHVFVCVCMCVFL